MQKCKAFSTVLVTPREFIGGCQFGTNLQGADFIQAQWEESLSARGQNMDAFINAGGIEQQAAIYGAVVNCVDGPSANYVSVGGSNRTYITWSLKRASQALLSQPQNPPKYPAMPVPQCQWVWSTASGEPLAAHRQPRVEAVCIGSRL